jgi:Rrf2 family nitric oxide-sensitive transcriptional repressor
MRLTRFTDNALRCLMYLGAAPERTPTVAEVASRMGMSEDHLTKVVQRLAQRGYVQTIRGRNGGVRLARASADITVGAVVRDMEEDWRLVPCFEDAAACPISQVCALAGVFDDALAAFMQALDRQTIAGLLGGRAELVRGVRPARVANA